MLFRSVICPGQSLLLQPGSFASYQWQDNSNLPVFSVTQSGRYFVSVRNNEGCVGSDTVRVLVDCSEIFFPAAFTPDGDGLNEQFGASGNVQALSEYQLVIYNRWGQRIFYSSSPIEKWDGYYNGKLCDRSTYVWIASYRLAGRSSVQKKGTILLLR